jgi:signal transduction histidine kinase
MQPTFTIGILADLNPPILVLLLSIALADRYRLIRIDKERAERVSLEQTEFFVNLSHEIKTPLTLITNYLDSYLENREMTPEIEAIKRNVDKLLRDMINFFDVLKLRKGLHVYRHDSVVDLSSFIKSKAELFKSTAARGGIDLSADIEPGLYSKIDPSALERIVNNLVENAIKYNKPGGSVGIRLASRGERIDLDVRDTGIGIDSEHIGKLFLPYFQITHKKGNRQGMGLGLSIVKGIVEELQGSIRLRSDPGVGSTFTITLDRHVPREGEPVFDDASLFYPGGSESPPELPARDLPIENASPSSAPNAGAQHSVLVVEDNEDLRSLLVGRLSGKFWVNAASNGKEALERLGDFELPDVVVSDIMMDTMDGYALFDVLSKDERYAGIPFIFVTARSTVDEKLDGLRKGAVDFIFKPFIIDELISKIESIIRYQDLKKELFEKDKFASIGMLLGGISHEIYNPLSGINAPLENIKKALRGTDLEKNGKIQKYIDYIETSVSRIEDIVANIRALYSNPSLEKRWVSIGEAADRAFGLFPEAAERGIVFQKDIADAPTVYAEEHALFQILRNLVANAIDSISGEGRILVGSRREGKATTLYVRDTGKGIDRSDRGRIFDAFFTTKAPPKGLGLGLYVVKDLVLKLKWEIRVDSELGQGTTFTISAKG